MKTSSDTPHLATAWEWVLRLREESVPQEELAAWMRWYEADDRNKEAFAEVSSFWQQAGRVTEGPDPLPRALWLTELTPSSGTRMPRRDIHDTARRWKAFATRRSRGAVWAVASVGVILCALLLAVSMRSTRMDTPQEVELAAAPPLAEETPLVTEVPLVRETHLPDGSRVELAANSSVTVQFTDKERFLTMQDGVAYFTVARNRDRPFVVKVGKLYVRAVGTAFNIRRARDRVVVTVTDGTVDVYPELPREPDASPTTHGAAEHAAGSIRVQAGREMTWVEKAAGPTIAAGDPSRALAWRQGRLDYLNEPLASAIADINRYSRRQIVIRDDAIGALVFSGTVLVKESDDWVKALPSLFPIEVLTDSQGNIVLTSRSS